MNNPTGFSLIIRPLTYAERIAEIQDRENLRHEKRLLSARKTYEKNKDLHRAKNIARTNRHRAGKAYPSWADATQILAVYQECDDLLWDTDLRYEVDHIIPLKHPKVCGLHVHNNLQILTQEQNRSKDNLYED